MKVLFTNIQLNHRTGTEIVIRDLALGVRRRGHEVAIYTPNPGPLAGELLDHGVPVLDRIDDVPFTPDVIHGHHHSPTVEALTRFHATPAIWVCHDRYQYEDIPPKHSNINRFVAVDLNCSERLVFEAGLPESRVRLIHNAVDLDRFRQRSALPPTLTRAAVFSNNAAAGGFLDAITEGCRQRNVPLDVIGEAAGTSSDAPEEALGAYDIVFAKARCALEALASGCAVVLIDHLGIGPMVTTANMAMLRDWNFGARCLQGVPTAERIVAALDQFDPVDAALVTDWVRSVAGLRDCLDQYLNLYEEVVCEGPAPRPHVPASVADLSLQYAASLEQRLRELQVPILSMPLPPTIAADVALRVSCAQSCVRPGERFTVEATISNHSAETLASIAPFPVHLSYHWVCLGEGSRGKELEGIRTPLKQALHPGCAMTVRAAVDAPTEPGSYALRVSLLQELVFWFDELTPPVACWMTVAVAEPPTGPRVTRPTMTLCGLQAGASPAMTEDFRVVRDGTFSDLGFVHDCGTQLLVFAGSAGFVKRALANSAVTCIVTNPALTDLVPAEVGVAVATDPKEAFFRLHNWIARSTSLYADDWDTTVSPSATVHPSATIDPRCVSIGDGCVIAANVVITGPVSIGARTTVDAGAVIGASGFQTSSRSGPYVELAHVGGVRIGDDCHVYSNATVARGVFRASTEVGNRCQIGNNAFVSHQCRLGDNVFVGHNATISGRVVVGDDVWIGPGAIISNELTIGTGARIAMGSHVMQDVAETARISGLPALEQQLMFRHAVAMRSKGN